MLSDFTKRAKGNQFLDLTRLPTPTNYFAGLGYQFKGNKVWRNTNCPFHVDTRPSLSVHMDKGAFRCFSCGAKGGDLLDFHRLLHKMSFVDACKDLGAWEVL